MLKESVLNQCHDCHSPIPQSIEITQLDLMMGVRVFDRDFISFIDS